MGEDDNRKLVKGRVVRRTRVLNMKWLLYAMEAWLKSVALSASRADWMIKSFVKRPSFGPPASF